MRVLIAECKQEVSTFNPALSHYNDFVTSEGGEVLDFHADIRSEVGGALAVFRDAGIDAVGAFSARDNTSGGTLAAADWDRLAADFLDGIRTAPAVDGCFITFHGAMCAQNESDPEGYLLKETRKILGDDIPIVCSFDLHGIVTDRMLEQIDGLAAFHTYPHNDFYETGFRAAKLLVRILRGEVKPVTAVVRIPALVRGEELNTTTGLIGGRIREAQAFEAAGGLSGNMFWGNPFTDVPELSSYSLVISDNDPAWATKQALEMAEHFWADRAQMQASLVSLDQAVQEAKHMLGKGTLILIDPADAPSSGASGDSNAILRALIEGGYEGRLLFPIVDAPAAEKAFAAGVGARITTTLGGSLDPDRFTPLMVEGEVRMLSDGRFVNESIGTEWYSGHTAVLEIGRHTVVVTSRSVSLFDRSLFYAHGQDPSRFDVVVRKSPGSQHRFYAAWAAKLITVDAPGSTSANLSYLGHTVCPRPMYPMELDTAFIPQVKLFQRR